MSIINSTPLLRCSQVLDHQRVGLLPELWRTVGLPVRVGGLDGIQLGESIMHPGYDGVCCQVHIKPGDKRGSNEGGRRRGVD